VRDSNITQDITILEHAELDEEKILPGGFLVLSRLEKDIFPPIMQGQQIFGGFHELAHFNLNHLSCLFNSWAKCTAINISVAALAGYFSQSYTAAIASFITGSFLVGLKNAALCRRLEAEADQVACNELLKLGQLDPILADLFVHRACSKSSAVPSGPAYFETHPRPHERALTLEYCLSAKDIDVQEVFINFCFKHLELFLKSSGTTSGVSKKQK
jgi:hypothetical protein